MYFQWKIEVVSLELKLEIIYELFEIIRVYNRPIEIIYELKLEPPQSELGTLHKLKVRDKAHAMAANTKLYTD